MHPRSLILVALFCAAGASAGEAVVRIDCQPAGSGPCATPPAPPAPPASPPPPPPLPDVPDEAHAACANKATGSKVTLKLGPTETMSGLCERVGGKMVFQLRSYRLDD
ncbi:MAG: hypothetical protein JWP72_2070 [Massilia sp.]|nr:hypothetical protein [Massilia sp.]MDB5790702.1 hypothetical protein [Massilia sp.]